MEHLSYIKIEETGQRGGDYGIHQPMHDERMSEMEVREGRNMFEEFLTFCQEYGIIDDYDGQLVMSLFQNLKERECCEEE